MGTVNIQKLVDGFIDSPCVDGLVACPHCAAVLAKDELQRVQEAASALTRLHLGDYVYAVRDTCGGDWHHIDVTAWNDAANLLRDIAEETHGRKP